MHLLLSRTWHAMLLLLPGRGGHACCLVKNQILMLLGYTGYGHKVRGTLSRAIVEECLEVSPVLGWGEHSCSWQCAPELLRSFMVPRCYVNSLAGAVCNGRRLAHSCPTNRCAPAGRPTTGRDRLCPGHILLPWGPWACTDTPVAMRSMSVHRHVLMP